ncbi:methyltransferase, FxLD system [Actinoallomurus sp. CA-150999]|uniref:methyltransferase, FxLD system n=1 Tax=Actinoallomurus sp. CA-150999 TaxID=3239887 RepID=UPI003D8AB585
MTPHIGTHGWREINVWFATWQAAQTAADTIGRRLVDLETSGTLTLWWFVRKGVEWRIRYLPEPGKAETTAEALGRTLDELTAHGRCTRWAHTIYEPPAAAFGGPEALNVAHVLFHADSRHVLDHLARRGGHQRELGVLLTVTMLRAARRDWYDQGQVWEFLTRQRTIPAQPPKPAATAAIHQLLTADPAPGRLGVPLAWFTAFEHAGATHFDLDRRGVTTRGLNAILAHHILYAWNRLGLPEPVQGALAHIAARLVFDDGTTPTAPPKAACPEPVTANVTAVTADTADSVASDPASLRNALADRILSLGTFRTAAVEAAFRTVPRELFLPGVDLAEAYAPKVVVTKRAPEGTALSSASSPNIVASQAEDLDVRPGHTILEIGAATGINAALLAEITGPHGRVVTIEIDQDLTDGARAALDKAGYSTVTIICGDGAAGWAKAAPYDRIIVTAGAWDISHAWWDQLAPAGRIVVPIRLHGSGLTRSLALDLQPTGELAGSYTRVCGFVPMRGESATDATTTVPLTDQVTLNTATAESPDESALAQALTHPAHTHWTGINVTDHEPVEHLDLWLATTTRGFARLSVSADARKAAIADPALRWAGASLYDGGTLAYITARQHGPVSREIGVIAHGPDSRRLTARLVELLQDWNHTRPARPIITAHRAGTPDDELSPGVRIERPDTRLTITW